MKRDHGPSAEGAASLHTTRWTIVMSAAQSQAQGGQSALAEMPRRLMLFAMPRLPPEASWAHENGGQTNLPALR